MAHTDRESHLVTPQTTTERLSAALMGGLESLVARQSAVGDRPVFDPAEFPWVAALEAEWPRIRADLDRVLEYRGQLPNFQDVTADVGTITDDDQWKTFIFCGYGMVSRANCEFCADTWRALQQVPGLKTAFFSILSPRKHIPEHRGPYNGVLRYHMGLRVPAARDRCWIRVADEHHCWDEGRSLVFDDSYNHEVRNDTDEYRAILFVDFLRPLRFPMNGVNRAFLRGAQWLPALREGQQRHQRWERGFYRR